MFKFLEGLDSDIQQTLLDQLRDLWTHTSTAIEGNSLSLGDTKFVLDEGLTVSGKPIKDHEEVIGHAKAVELMYNMVGRIVVEDDIFALHEAVQTERITDVHKPNGAWKVEPNGTYTVDENSNQVFVEYAQPAFVPALMGEVIGLINALSKTDLELIAAPSTYAKIHMGIAHIHPFWDGNGRIARLLANLPLLSSGLPPIVVAKEDRRNYIDILSRYQRKVGPLDENTGVWPLPEALSEFTVFCEIAYAATKRLVDNAHKQQRQRSGS